MMTVSVMLRAAIAIAVMTLSPSFGLAADGAWEANYACYITSPERGDSPRVTLSTGRKGEVGGELTSAVRFRLFNIPALSDKETEHLPNAAVEIPGFADWTGLTASGVQEKSGYSLYIPLPDIAQVLGPLEGGRILRVTYRRKALSRPSTST
jgi:hypothetical protein